MHTKNFLQLVFVLSLLQIIPAKAQSMAMCKAVAAEMRNQLPIKKDNLTTIRDVGCLPGKPKNIMINILDVDAPLSALKTIDFNKDMKPSNLRIYCSDPKIRPVLEAFDIDNRYYTLKGDFGGSFLMSSKECK
jgi:hypothetical protein